MSGEKILAETFRDWIPSVVDVSRTVFKFWYLENVGAQNWCRWIIAAFLGSVFRNGLLWIGDAQYACAFACPVGGDGEKPSTPFSRSCCTIENLPLSIRRITFALCYEKEGWPSEMEETVFVPGNGRVVFVSVVDGAPCSLCGHQSKGPPIG